MATSFRIADTFTDSLARLTGDEQKAVKTTALDLQMNPANPGMSFHKLDKARDRNFWSVRVSGDIRLIVHKMLGSLLLCYVDHHDKAYAWAERRKLEVHPTTGAAQLVEVHERVEEIAIPLYIAKETAPPPKPPLLASITDAELLGYGVPNEWLGAIHQATEDRLLEIAEYLPREAAEALIDLATGTKPAPAPVAAPSADPFEHPDAQRRFRVVTDVEELTRALEYPWDKWTIFLHPSQRDIVDRRFNGPARVTGSAGTGKTVVALHRAVALATAFPESRTLLTTFSETLAAALAVGLRRLIGNSPRLGERIDVASLYVVAKRLYERNIGTVQIATANDVRAAIDRARDAHPTKPSAAFIRAEWEHVVDAWQLEDWRSYRDVPRLGRRTRLSEKQRAEAWTVLDAVRVTLVQRGLTAQATVYTRLAAHFASTAKRPYDFIVVDEAQDLSISQLRFLGALGGDRPDALFFAGDLGQRIFQQPFSWRQLGVDIRGRSSTLRVNYRTSHQIRSQADRLLEQSIAEVDGNEVRREAISVFNGPAPEVHRYDRVDDETGAVSAWLAAQVAAGASATEIGVFVRSPDELARAEEAAMRASLPYRLLDTARGGVSGFASIATMHLAKGLEFRVVAVMACDDEVIPSQTRIETAGDEAELAEVYATERQLLYVACTRARDALWVSGVEPVSEFIDDLTHSA